jgi:hypothetical protein
MVVQPCTSSEKIFARILMDKEYQKSEKDKSNNMRLLWVQIAAQI